MVFTETPDYSDRILKYNCNFSGQGRPHGRGNNWGIFPRPQPERGPADPIRGPLNTCLKERLIYSNRAVTVFFRGAV